MALLVTVYPLRYLLYLLGTYKLLLQPNLPAYPRYLTTYMEVPPTAVCTVAPTTWNRDVAHRKGRGGCKALATGLVG
jgi:hypothetical protein